MTSWWAQTLLLLGLFGSLLVVATIPFHDVTRGRVRRFAERQRLPITVANGLMVLRYLATTRRWRGTGLLASIVGTVVLTHLRHTGKGLDFSITGLFIGWFVGAVIAEWRVTVRTSTSPRRVAMLRPRRAQDYLAGWVQWAVRVSLAAVLLLCLVGQAFTPRHLLLGGLLALGVASGALVSLVSRHILQRPQPAVEPTILAADESIRSRSLHVLAGSLIAICSWIGPTALELLLHGRARVTSGDIVGALSAVLLLLGAYIATHTSMQPRRAQLAATPRALAT